MKIFIATIVMAGAVAFFVLNKTDEPEKEPNKPVQPTPKMTDARESFMLAVNPEESLSIIETLLNKKSGDKVVLSGGVGKIYNERAVFRLMDPDLLATCNDAKPEAPWHPC